MTKLREHCDSKEESKETAGRIPVFWGVELNPNKVNDKENVVPAAIAAKTNTGWTDSRRQHSSFFL